MTEPNTISPEVLDLIQPIIEGLEFEVVSIDLLGKGQRRTLQILVDRPGGISIDDCADISRSLSRLLDVEDPFDFEYSLEVGSPGVYRELKHDKDFQRQQGDRVKVSLFEPVNETHTLFGDLSGFDEDNVHILDEASKGELKIERTNIKRLCLEPKL